jgi:hypothetical protein
MIASKRWTTIGVTVFFLLFPLLSWAQSGALILSSTSPSAVFVGSTGVVIMISGSGFGSNSVANIRGNSFPVTLLSGNTLTVAVPDSLFVSPGAIPVKVANSSTLISNTVFVFVVTNQPPTITSIIPANAAAGSTLAVTISGSNLVGATAAIAGSGVTVTASASTSATSFTFTLTIAPSATSGTRQVSVATPVGSTNVLSSGGPCLFEIGAMPPLPNPGTVVNAAPPLIPITVNQVPTSTLLKDGRVLIAGDGTTNAQIYDPTLDTWKVTGMMILPRSVANATLLPDGRVVVSGGSVYGSDTQSVEIFDTATEVWSPAGLLPSSLRGSHGLLLPNGHVQFGYGAGKEIYNPFTGAFSAASGTDAAEFDVPGVTNFGAAIANVKWPLDGASVYSARLLPNGDWLVRISAAPCGFITCYSIETVIFHPSNSSFTNIKDDPAPWLLLSDDRILTDIGILDTSTGSMSPATVGIRTPAYESEENGINLLGDGRVFHLTASSAQLFSPPGLANRPATVSSVSTTPLESAGWLSVEVDGNNFAASAVVALNSSRLVTIYTGPNKLFAFVPPALSSSATPGGFSVVNLATTSVPQPPAPPPPFVSSITPQSGYAGATVNAVVNGSNLSAATAVTFDQTALSAVIQQGGTSNQLPIAISIGSNATVGLHTVTVTTPGGAFTATGAFIVQALSSVPTTAPQPIPAVESGNIKVGYVVITPDATTASPLATVTYGIVQNGTVQSQAGVLPAAMTTDASMFVNVVTGIGRNLGVAMTNPGSSALTVTLTLKDSTGALQANSVSITLQPGQQLARFVNELFGSAVIGPGFTGSLRIQSASPVSVLGLLFSGSEFSTLPIAGTTTVPGVPVRDLTAGANKNSPASGSIGGANASIIPQFAMGGNWATQIALVNPTSATATGRVDVFDSLGNPFPVNLNGMIQSTFTYSVQTGGTLLLAPRDSNGQSPF